MFLVTLIMLNKETAKYKQEMTSYLSTQGEETTLLPLGFVCFSRLTVKYCKVNLEFALPTSQN